MYIGVDLNSCVQADNIGIEKQEYVTRNKLGKSLIRLVTLLLSIE